MKTFTYAIVLSSLIIPVGAAFAQTNVAPLPSTPLSGQGAPLPPIQQPSDQFPPPPPNQRPDQFLPQGKPSPAQGQPGQFPQGDPASRQGGPNFQGQEKPEQFHPEFMRQHMNPDKSRMPNGNSPGENTQNATDANQMQQHQEQQQKEQNDRMIANMQQGSKQMERQLAMIVSRIKKLQSQGAVIPADLQSAIDRAKAFIDKMKNVKTSDEIQILMEDNSFGDLMQTINEGMQKAEMSTQFPRMLQEANRNLKQQQSMLARAQARAKTLKTNVDSILTKWQKSVNDISQGVNEANTLFQNNNPEEAINTLKDKVFDVFQDIGDQQRIFEMVSNSQQALKQADREFARIDKQIARLKKQGEDTSQVEDLLAQVRAKTAEIKGILAQPNIDSEALVNAIEDVQGMKDDLYEALSDLTGKQFNPEQQGHIPGLQFKPIEAPKGFGKLFQNSDQNKEKGPQTQTAPGPQASTNALYQAALSIKTSILGLFKGTILGGR